MRAVLVSRVLSSVVAVAVAVLAPGHAAAAAPEAPLRVSLDRARPVRAALTLTVDPDGTTFAGVADLTVQLDRPTRTLALNAVDLTIREATAQLGGADVPVTVTPAEPEWITVAFDRPVRGEVQLRFAYDGLVSDTETQGVFRQREGEDWYLFTEFEPTDARRLFPGFDQPDAKIPWTITLRVPDGLGAFANTAAIETVDEPGPLTRVRFAETRPLPSYLLAFAVGPFDTVDAGTAGQNHVPLRIITPRR
ncbi:MAG: M1 family peptidase, partial [Myxococcota bacterium]